MRKKTCEQCGREYKVRPYEKDTRRFCSRECMGKWRSENIRGENHSQWKGGKITKKCEQCGGEFEVIRSQADTKRFCSRKCYSKWRSGENHPRYKPKAKLICDQCGGEFEVIPSFSKQRFCSRKCYFKWRSGKNNPKWKRKIVKICKQCGKEYDVHPSRKDTRCFCSIDCMGRWYSENMLGENNPGWKEKIVKICEQCGREFEVYPHEKDESRFCSRECQGKWQSDTRCGENSPTWKGGLSFEPYCHKFNEKFKESIREKFGRVCFLCPTTEEENGQKLSVHHTNYNKDCLCDDSDCEFVPLCIACHSKTNANRDYWEKTIMDKLIKAIN